MSTRIPKGGKCKEAAIFCRDFEATDEQASYIFGVKIGSIKCARSQLGIPMTGSTRAPFGSIVRTAEQYLQSDLTLKSFAREKAVKLGSLASALSRMGVSNLKLKPNRRLMKNKGLYYFRVRTEALDVFTKLSTDLTKARLMRDKLEKKYML